MAMFNSYVAAMLNYQRVVGGTTDRDTLGPASGSLSARLCCDRPALQSAPTWRLVLKTGVATCPTLNINQQLYIYIYMLWCNGIISKKCLQVIFTIKKRQAHTFTTVKWWSKHCMLAIHPWKQNKTNESFGSCSNPIPQYWTYTFCGPNFLGCHERGIFAGSTWDRITDAGHV